MAHAPIALSSYRLDADERRWEAECHGKNSYPSEASAQAVLAHIKREPRHEKLCWLTTYECSFCGGWHLGNIKRFR